MPQVDVSKTLSMGNILPLGAAKVPKLLVSGRDTRDMISEFVKNSSGPWGSIIEKGFNSFSSEHEGWKQFETMLPTALSNASMGMRYLVDGYENSKDGTEYISGITTGESMAKMLGFVPTKIARQRDYIGDMYEFDRYWTARRAAVMEDFRRTYEFGLVNREKPNQQERDRVIAEIRKHKLAAPPKYDIDISDLQQSARQKVKQANAIRQGLIVPPAQNDQYRRIHKITE
jgi:hypothetical protein